jgi:chemotaxis protein methyltransferase CheR
MQLGRADEALRRLEMSTGARDVDRDALLLRAVLLTSGGNIRAAEQTCERLLAEDELNAGAHYVLALCRENGGDLEAAIEHDRTALYLDADFSMPHLHLGLIARRRRDLLTAHRELKLALGLLARDEPSRVMLFGGGFGREGLLQLCRTELKALEGGGP